MRIIEQFLLFVILVAVAGAVLARAVASARNSAIPKEYRPKGVKGRTRQALAAVATPGHIRAAANGRVKEIWANAHAADWLEGRRHHRGNGTDPDGGLAGRLRPFRPGVQGGANGHGNGITSPATPGTAPPGAGTGRQPPPPSQQTQTMPPRPGGNPMAAGTSTASAEKLIEGINEIHAHAGAGGIHAKREAIRAMHEAQVRFAQMMQMLARQMSEPGSSYGPEITEPLARAGSHATAAAMTLGESDAAITTLINMTVGDLASSPRRAPDKSELSESGGGVLVTEGSGPSVAWR